MNYIFNFLWKISFTVFIILLTSCSDDNSNQNTKTDCESFDYTCASCTSLNLPLKTVIDLKADTNSTKTYTYYSLKDNAIIPPSDSDSKKWDIAFYATNIVTNSGVRGPGDGGVILVRNKDFAKIRQAPVDCFKKDDSFITPAILPGSGNGWYVYTGEPNHSILPIAGTSLIIKTAEGRYAKLRILNYYNGNPPLDKIDTSSKMRYFSFEYEYQPDGTPRF